ncbi:hypothetical protein VOLCADRAFT_103332 [Volvox carteri f. nagariensis]|uniref:Uncharacterized protein n=1 Tax=Volvox carteri f. nagariensis TaxID=3068 RepID=D8TLA2_VOLCA|nr:uncharacterized protein VOLCADRAFT_103332 [Volvox carteri f. nagariensis]EFJ51838.1 hypothetical protein VOLCADRAFT_103332 [Volvox carteri f. nagariensis]|eukprot:XP_002947248.1 hypothetical protein VOLCADRAFT_103332 [Volvox carteri f. nagariensis]
MNHGACMEVFGAEKSQASAMEVLEKPPCKVLYPQFCVQALCGFDGSSCGVKYASFAAFAPAVLDTDAGMPCFQTCCRSAGFEARRRCPAGVLGPRDIEAAIMDTGGDAGSLVPRVVDGKGKASVLVCLTNVNPHGNPDMAPQADTFFRENQLPAYYGEIDSIRNHQLKRSADAASLRVAATQRVATDPSVIVPFRSAEGLERAGHVELFERLKVVTSALIAERADRIALDREIKRRTSLFQADRDLNYKDKQNQRATLK